MKRTLSILAALVVALAANPVWAQGYPARPVKLVVTYPPGGSSDLMARIFGQKLGDLWGQQVLIESKPGAAGAIGMEYAARQPNDGYTFVIGNIGPVAVNPLLSKVPYDMARDFVPVSLISTGPNILVVNPNKTDAKTLNDVIAMAKAGGGKVSFGSSGPGSVAQLAGEMFKIQAKLDLIHVPYKGGILSVNDLVGCQIDMVFSDALPVMQNIRAGKLRPICQTGPQRSPLVGDVPTCAESGMPGLVIENWWGVYFPAGTPKPILDKVSKDIAQVLAMPDVMEKLNVQGSIPAPNTPEQFDAIIKSDTERYGKILRDAGVGTN
jgi:tripartite-type tricarboxylate transporter receptor subunit TctC